MRIAPFKVEEWMNAYELEAVYNIAETCVDSLTVEELIRLSAEPVDFFAEMAQKKLTYGHIEGSPEFRSLVAGMYKTLTPDNILVMNGAIGANFLALFSLVGPGDEVVSVHPTYQQIYEVPASFGAEVKLLRLVPEKQFLPDLDELRTLVTDKTKLICINNPNNPSGALMDEVTLREIVEIARSVDAYVLCDEVYRHLHQDPEIEVPSIVDLYEKGIATSSMSKVFSLAGLRLGWIAAPLDVIKNCFSHRDYTTISCGMLDDMLAVHALKNRDKIMERNLKIVRDNLQILDEWVAAEPLISYVKPKAGTTAMLKYELDMPSEAFCIELFRATGAFLTPGSCFDMEGWVRIGYACDTEVLQAGLAQVSKFLRERS
ncbi:MULTISPECIES: aminotransferase [Brevibacillus]|uniref:aminotransferase n=1 Tax=Brevibacillus TaxID=55080 RepID=UPI0024753545|nr:MULTISPECIES: aminotransferase [Brevibacillus]MDH6353150.1 aspartate/methionine/tyrosine aminotransferase [Brevibacillus sp. 1238]MDR5001970.1 aminotransferase [Brevibacillus parabrevis]